MTQNLLNAAPLKSKLIFPFLLSLLLGSCAQSKSSQCQRIFEIANQVTKETQTLTKSGRDVEMKTWLLAADKMEQAALDMEKLEITDTNLQAYQQGFAQVYREYAQATQEIVKVWENKDRIAAKAAQEKVRRAGKMEQELGQKINSYCRAQ